MKTTVKKVNEALAKHFGENKIELVKGKGYFYFSGELALKMKSTGIYVFSISNLSVFSLVRAAEIKLAESE